MSEILDYRLKIVDYCNLDLAISEIFNLKCNPGALSMFSDCYPIKIACHKVATTCNLDRI